MTGQSLAQAVGMMERSIHTNQPITDNDGTAWRKADFVEMVCADGNFNSVEHAVQCMEEYVAVVEEQNRDLRKRVTELEGGIDRGARDESVKVLPPEGAFQTTMDSILRRLDKLEARTTDDGK